MGPTVARIERGPVAPMWLHFMAENPPPNELSFLRVPGPTRWARLDAESAWSWETDPDAEVVVYRRASDAPALELGGNDVWDYEPA